MNTDINDEWLPTTPLQVRAFVGTNFVSASFNPETGEGQYVMTEHDLLQAFEELRCTACNELAALRAQEPQPVEVTDEQILQCIPDELSPRHRRHVIAAVRAVLALHDGGAT